MCINNSKLIIYIHFFTSLGNLKCTPLDRQMYPQGYMYPSLGTPGLRYTQECFACYQNCSFSSFEPVLLIHCLVALDLGAGDVEQPFNCLIMQNRQAVQSIVHCLHKSKLLFNTYYEWKACFVDPRVISIVFKFWLRIIMETTIICAVFLKEFPHTFCCLFHVKICYKTNANT